MENVKEGKGRGRVQRLVREISTMGKQEFLEAATLCARIITRIGDMEKGQGVIK